MRRAATLLAAALAALLPASALAAEWTTFGAGNSRGGYNPAETAITPATAGSLRHLWAYDLGGVVNAQPLYLDGVVYAGSEAGTFAALDAATGEALWTRELSTVDTICNDVPDGLHGISATPVIDPAARTVWVAGGDSRVWALDIDTGKTRPGWPVRSGKKNEHVWGALALSRRRLYVATASHCDNAFYRGRIAIFDPQTGERRREWLPVGKRWHGGGVWGWGGVVIAPDGDVYAATANAQYPKPENYRYAEHVVRLSRRLEVKVANYPGLPKMDDNDFGGSPMLFKAPGCPRQLVVVHKSGELLLYDRRALREGPRQRLAAGSLEAFTGLGTHAWSPETRMLYLANNSRGDFSQGLVALRLTEACRLELAWERPMAPPQSWPTTPALAGGVVIYGDGSGKQLHAFDALDGTPLWSSGQVTGDLYGAPIVVDGRVFAPSWDEKIHAFGGM